MKIYDENDIEILESDVDLTKGKLKEQKIFKEHHEKVNEVQEQSHYEIVAEYENGGKDVKKVIDVEYVAPQEAYDEYEDILRYVLFDENETKEKLKDLKEVKMKEAEDKLKAFFEENPLESKAHGNKNGEYAVTKDAVDRLAGNYQTYLVKKQEGLNPVLQWNEAVGRCEEWTEAELKTLMNEMEEYIHGYEDVKQDYLADITECNTIEELEAIHIEYKKNS